MMKRFAVAPSSLQRLLATRSPHRTIPLYRFLSAASYEDISDIIPDYFDTLGVERSFSIDTDQLKQSYKSLMSKLHPDLHRNKSEEEQDDLHDRASNVTQAYRTLKNPQHRALHLLEIMGKPLEESATASLLGPDFLMDIMEIREAIDHAICQKEIQMLMQEIDGHLSTTTQKLADAFENEKLESALKLTAELQYWNRAHETLQEKVIVS